MKKLILTSAIAVLMVNTVVANDVLEDELAIKKQNLLMPVVKKFIAPDAEILATISYLVDITGATTWDRPFTLGDGTSGSCSISSSGPVAHMVQFLTVDVTGLYTITADHTVGGASYDGYLHLYELVFDTVDQCVNLVALDDDWTGLDDSQILNVTLTAGTQYWVVHSGWGAGDEGVSEITIDGVGQPTLPVELQSFSID